MDAPPRDILDVTTSNEEKEARIRTKGSVVSLERIRQSFVSFEDGQRRRLQPGVVVVIKLPSVIHGWPALTIDER